MIQKYVGRQVNIWKLTRKWQKDIKIKSEEGKLASRIVYKRGRKVVRLLGRKVDRLKGLLYTNLINIVWINVKC